MQSKLLTLVLFFGISVSFNACQEDSRAKVLVGQWSYLEFQMNDQVMSGKELGNPTMHFKNDGNYNITFGEMSEDGRWRLEGDNLITDSKKHKKDNVLLIVELSESKLVLEGEAEGNKIIITLVPEKAHAE